MLFFSSPQWKDLSYSFNPALDPAPLHPPNCHLVLLSPAHVSLCLICCHLRVGDMPSLLCSQSSMSRGTVWWTGWAVIMFHSCSTASFALCRVFKFLYTHGCVCVCLSGSINSMEVSWMRELAASQGHAAQVSVNWLLILVQREWWEAGSRSTGGGRGEGGSQFPPMKAERIATSHTYT